MILKAIKRVMNVFLALFFVVNVFSFSNYQTYSLVDPEVEKAEIDVVYKYIDLTDPTLHRDGIPQIKKDYDNNELMYSLRSVLKNIPWVRKIFIIMPNDRVKFLKVPEEISDKIVYIKDKDILGFDGASSICFEFSLWKLRDFGCSENFIYLNDDYFIGKPLNKSDFFYQDGNKIVPYVIQKHKGEHGQYNKMKNQWTEARKYRGPRTHSGQAFRIQLLNSLMFLYKIFNRDILVSLGYAHNALGENLTELKELYDLVNNHYEYADDCLRAKVRSNNALQHQLTYNFYVINKYNRKINTAISYRYIDLDQVQYNHFDYDLFCINTGGNREYSDMERVKAKIKIEQLFPKPTKYERKDYNDWAGVDPALKEHLKNEMAALKYVPRRRFTLIRAS